MSQPTWTPPPPHMFALPGAIETKPVPYNQQAEEAVLGSLLIDRDAIFAIRPILNADDFFFADTLGAVYGAIGALADRAVPADLVTLADHLARRGLLDKIGGPGTLAHWRWVTPTASHVVYYARIVAEYAQVRRLISEGGTVAGLGYDTSRPAGDVLAEARQRILDATLPRDEQGLRPIKDVADELRATIFAPRRHPGQVRGLPTSLPWLDALTGGLQKQNVYMVAARPGKGKTSIMTQIAAHNARLGVNVGVFSLEMNDEQLMRRFLAQATPCDLQRLESGYLSEAEWAAAERTYNTITDEWTLFLDPTPAVNIHEAAARARQRALTDGLDLICFDYLQLFHADRKRGDNRQEEVAAVSRAIKDLARELDVPVLALGQLNRGVEYRNSEPTLADLRESGQIEQDAYLVAFLHRADEDDPWTDFIVAKHRNGKTGRTRLYFEGPTTTFHDEEMWARRQHGGRHA